MMPQSASRKGISYRVKPRVRSFALSRQAKVFPPDGRAFESPLSGEKQNVSRIGESFPDDEGAQP